MNHSMIPYLKKFPQMFINPGTITPKSCKRLLHLVYFLLIPVFSTVSCSHIPKIYKAEFTDPAQILERCHAVFPDGDRRFVHSIEAELAGGNNAFMLGITRISPQNRTIWAVMMTFEGMVLFDAVHNDSMVINRAIPPFDSEFFAQGLMEDIRLIFFEPEGHPIEIGTLVSGESICRFHTHEEMITDVTIGQHSHVTINRYHRQRLHRSIRLYRGETQSDPSIFQRLELIAHGPVKYKMKLNLLEAEFLNE